jgi:hypothetical protein
MSIVQARGVLKRCERLSVFSNGDRLEVLVVQGEKAVTPVELAQAVQVVLRREGGSSS